MQVQSKPNSAYPWWIRLIFSAQIKKYGQTLESAKIWARSPRLFLGVSLLFMGLERKRSPINAELRALITVYVSQINHCSFCVDLNSARALEFGSSKEKINHLHNFKTSTHFSEEEKLALELADCITRTEGKVSTDLWTQIKQHYSQDAIVDLTGLIAFQNLSSKFNEALEIQPQGFCTLK